MSSTDYRINDSGNREQFDTGAQRDTEDGKPRLVLLPFRALWRLGQHYTAGALKYDAHNWRKGIKVSRCLSSALRHLFQWAQGQRDEDHLSAAAFNILTIMEYEESNRSDLLDSDLPPECQNSPAPSPQPKADWVTCSSCRIFLDATLLPRDEYHFRPGVVCPKCQNWVCLEWGRDRAASLLGKLKGGF